MFFIVKAKESTKTKQTWSHNCHTTTIKKIGSISLIPEVNSKKLNIRGILVKGTQKNKVHQNIAKAGAQNQNKLLTFKLNHLRLRQSNKCLKVQNEEIQYEY